MQLLEHHGTFANDLVIADIAVVADFRANDLAWRLESEIRVQAELGYRTVLIHIPSNRGQGFSIHPDINACIADGLAVPIEPETRAVRARLALVYGAEDLFDLLLSGHVVPLPRIHADRVVALSLYQPLSHNEPIYRQADSLIRSAFGAITVWGTDSIASRERLRGFGLNVINELWWPSLSSKKFTPNADAVSKVGPRIGCAGTGAAKWWQEDPAEMKSALGSFDQALVRLLLPSGLPLPSTPFPNEWEVLWCREVSLSNFFRGLDLFVYCGNLETCEPPLVAIAAAIRYGLPTILHPSLKKLFGQSAVYTHPTKVKGLAVHHFRQAKRNPGLRGQNLPEDEAFGPNIHGARLNALLGLPSLQPFARKSARGQRVLFVSPNGVGLGHLTRQIAIARRCPAHLEPVFATMSQGFRIVKQAGFSAEYIPFHDQARFDMERWESWFTRQLMQIMIHYEVNCLVFDGANPYLGLIEALKLRRDLSAVWVRRAMWRKTQTRHLLHHQRYFSLIVEPGEIAAAQDEGATIAWRRGTMQVPPIRLLDADELLDRKTAIERLGLDASKSAVLIQLGAGLNRDIVSIIDSILSILREHKETQPVIAEWHISTLPAGLWADVPRIRTFPLSRYYSAFDFTISATGYNSFNEIISFELPAIFLSNNSSAIDNQTARATFAEKEGASITLSDQDLMGLRLAVRTLLQEPARWFLKANCRRLAQPNGAIEVADAIAALCAT